MQRFWIIWMNFTVLVFNSILNSSYNKTWENGIYLYHNHALIEKFHGLSGKNSLKLLKNVYLLFAETWLKWFIFILWDSVLSGFAIQNFFLRIDKINTSFQLLRNILYLLKCSIYFDSSGKIFLCLLELANIIAIKCDFPVFP